MRQCATSLGITDWYVKGGSEVNELLTAISHQQSLLNLCSSCMFSSSHAESLASDGFVVQQADNTEDDVWDDSAILKVISGLLICFMPIFCG